MKTLRQVRLFPRDANEAGDRSICGLPAGLEDVDSVDFQFSRENWRLILLLLTRELRIVTLEFPVVVSLRCFQALSLPPGTDSVRKKGL